MFGYFSTLSMKGLKVVKIGKCDCFLKSNYNKTENQNNQCDLDLDKVLDLYNTGQKWSFPLKISSVNVTKSAENCGFGHIYWRNPQWQT